MKIIRKRQKNQEQASFFSNLGDFKWYGRILENKELKKYIKSTTLEDANNIFKEIFASPRVSATIYGVSDPKNIMKKAEFKNLFKFEK